MSKMKTNNRRRQLPENFHTGDHIAITLTAQGVITAKEQTNSGDWLLTIGIEQLLTTAKETKGSGDDLKATTRTCSVLWSATNDGKVEFVFDVGARQRLVALGVSAKQKQVLKKHLAALPAAEAQQLLEEISAEPTEVAGHLGNGNPPAGKKKND